MSEPYKIWRNPETPEEPPRYMGDFYPPEGQAFFVHTDLEALGFPPGSYSVRIPEDVRHAVTVQKWQYVKVSS